MFLDVKVATLSDIWMHSLSVAHFMSHTLSDTHFTHDIIYIYTSHRIYSHTWHSYIYIYMSLSDVRMSHTLSLLDVTFNDTHFTNSTLQLNLIHNSPYDAFTFTHVATLSDIWMHSLSVAHFMSHTLYDTLNYIQFTHISYIHPLYSARKPFTFTPLC